MGLTFLADGGLGGLSAGDFWDILSSVFAKELFDVFFFKLLTFLWKEKKKLKNLSPHMLDILQSWQFVYHGGVLFLLLVVYFFLIQILLN